MQDPAADDALKPLMSPADADLPSESSKSRATYGSEDVQKEPAPVEPRDSSPVSKPGDTRMRSGKEAGINLALDGSSREKGRVSEPEPLTEQRAGGGAAVQRNAGQPADSAQPTESNGLAPTGTQEDLSLFAAGAPGASVEGGEIQASEKDSFARVALEEAANEAGFVCLKPAYLPRGAELQDVTWLSGMVCQNYRVGQLSFRICQELAKAPMAEIESASREHVELEINGAKGILKETKPGDEDGTFRGYTTITWQQGELLITVEGNCPGRNWLKCFFLEMIGTPKNKNTSTAAKTWACGAFLPAYWRVFLGAINYNVHAPFYYFLHNNISAGDNGVSGKEQQLLSDFFSLGRNLSELAMADQTMSICKAYYTITAIIIILISGTYCHIFLALSRPPQTLFRKGDLKNVR